MPSAATTPCSESPSRNIRCAVAAGGELLGDRGRDERYPLDPKSKFPEAARPCRPRSVDGARREANAPRIIHRSTFSRSTSYAISRIADRRRSRRRRAHPRPRAARPPAGRPDGRPHRGRAARRAGAATPHRAATRRTAPGPSTGRPKRGLTAPAATGGNGCGLPARGAGCLRAPKTRFCDVPRGVDVGRPASRQQGMESDVAAALRPRL